MNSENNFVSVLIMFISTLIVTIPLVACTSLPRRGYAGEERKIEDVAIIVDRVGFTAGYRSRLKGGFVILNTIDGARGRDLDIGRSQNPNFHFAVAGSSTPLKVAVSPGQRLLQVDFLGVEYDEIPPTGMHSADVGRKDYRSTAKLQFNAEKGHTYLLTFIHYEKYSDKWLPVILDLTAWKQSYPKEKIEKRSGGYSMTGPGMRDWLNDKRIHLK